MEGYALRSRGEVPPDVHESQTDVQTTDRTGCHTVTRVPDPSVVLTLPDIQQSPGAR